MQTVYMYMYMYMYMDYNYKVDTASLLQGVNDYQPCFKGLMHVIVQQMI